MSQSLRDVVRAGVAGRLVAANLCEDDGDAAFQTPKKNQTEESEAKSSGKPSGSGLAPDSLPEGAVDSQEPLSQQVQVLPDGSELPDAPQLRVPELDWKLPGDGDQQAAPGPQQTVTEKAESSEVQRQDTSEFQATEDEAEAEESEEVETKKRPATGGDAAGRKKQKVNPKPKSKQMKRPAAAGSEVEPEPVFKRPAAKQSAAKKQEQKNEAESESKEPIGPPEAPEGSILPIECWKWIEPDDDHANHVRECIYGEWKAEA